LDFDAGFFGEPIGVAVGAIGVLDDVFEFDFLVVCDRGPAELRPMDGLQPGMTIENFTTRKVQKKWAGELKVRVAMRLVS